LPGDPQWISLASARGKKNSALAVPDQGKGQARKGGSVDLFEEIRGLLPCAKRGEEKCGRGGPNLLHLGGEKKGGTSQREKKEGVWAYNLCAPREKKASSSQKGKTLFFDQDLPRSPFSSRLVQGRGGRKEERFPKKRSFLFPREDKGRSHRIQS